MKQKLKSPNFMLSPTRLSLRNLPYDVDEAQLKALVVAAVKERASKERPRVLSVKVLRESDRVGGDGKARSKVRGGLGRGLERSRGAQGGDRWGLSCCRGRHLLGPWRCTAKCNLFAP